MTTVSPYGIRLTTDALTGVRPDPAARPSADSSPDQTAEHDAGTRQGLRPPSLRYGPSDDGTPLSCWGVC